MATTTTPHLENTRWELDRLHEVRKREVLSQWDLGPEGVDLEEAAQFHRQLDPGRSAVVAVQEAQKEGRVLVQHRHGVNLIEQHIEELQYLEDVGGTDISSTQSDAYTRQLQYQRAEEALAESRRLNRSLTVGIPAHLYGVSGVRTITESLRKPSAIRMASSDGRLSKEIYMAAGFTYILMGAMQNLSYEKDASLATMIEHYQYEDRLMAWYQDQGAPMVKETTATLTGTLVPPAIALVCSTIDAALAATQGVQNIMLSYGVIGNIHQDIAAVRELRSFARARLDALGLTPHLSVVTSQWMADFPQDVDQAYGVIAYGTVAAALGGTDMILTKSLEEAFGVPTKEANASGLKITRQLLRILQNQEFKDNDTVAEERWAIRTEADAIFDRMLELGEGDVAKGAVLALEAGVIDVPFSPSRHNRGLMIPVKDSAGALRYADQGNLPFTESTLRWHRQRLEARRDLNPARSEYMLMVDDIFSMSKPLS